MLSVFQKTRDYFFKEIDKSKTLSDETKTNVKSQYFRGFSKKLDEQQFKSKSERSLEFNFRSEDNNKGIEWRSFNLHRVKTWEEFDEMFKIMWKCLEKLYNVSSKYSAKTNINLSKKMMKAFEKKKHEKEYNLTMKKYKSNKIKIKMPSNLYTDETLSIKSRAF